MQARHHSCGASRCKILISAFVFCGFYYLFFLLAKIHFVRLMNKTCTKSARTSLNKTLIQDKVYSNISLKMSYSFVVQFLKFIMF